METWRFIERGGVWPLPEGSADELLLGCSRSERQRNFPTQHVLNVWGFCARDAFVARAVDPIALDGIARQLDSETFSHEVLRCRCRVGRGFVPCPVGRVVKVLAVVARAELHVVPREEDEAVPRRVDRLRRSEGDICRSAEVEEFDHVVKGLVSLDSGQPFVLDEAFDNAHVSEPVFYRRTRIFH